MLYHVLRGRHYVTLSPAGPLFLGARRAGAVDAGKTNKKIPSRLHGAGWLFVAAWKSLGPASLTLGILQSV
jgi:hypothetical protein